MSCTSCIISSVYFGDLSISVCRDFPYYFLQLQSVTILWFVHPVPYFCIFGYLQSSVGQNDATVNNLEYLSFPIVHIVPYL